ncbi:DNA cytosine methyltransferase [Microcoleus sp. herbarium7]|uniref:DNA cytosine methyltransferase n=1 Tax=Microcoleus sp. herbarium7 TaxID=3055435 RepID=UPI002FD70B01
MSLLVGTEFSGGGVVDYALKKMGGKLVFAVEFDRPKAEKMYIPNHGNHVQISAVQDVDPAQLDIEPRKLDIFWVSPSCINFSKAKEKGVETEFDISAVNAVVRHIEYLRPKSVVVENVDDYEGSVSYNLIFNGLRKLGYHVKKYNLNSADYGTPQTRRRLYVIAVRSDIGRSPAIPPTHAEFPQPTLFGDALKPWVGWLEAVVDLIPDRPCYIPYWDDSEKLQWNIWENQKLRPAKTRERGLAEWHEKRVKEAIARKKLEGLFDYIIDGKNAGREITVKAGDRPCWTLVGSANSEAHWPRAFMVTTQEFSMKEARQGTEPCTTVTGQRISAAQLRAVLIPGANAGNNTPTVRMGDCPCVTVTPSAYPRGLFANQLSLKNATVEQKFKVLIDSCVIVKFNTRMLARLQGLGDDYYLCDNNDLASECIGNGVAVQVAQAIYRAIELVINK